MSVSLPPRSLLEYIDTSEDVLSFCLFYSISSSVICDRLHLKWTVDYRFYCHTSTPTGNARLENITYRVAGQAAYNRKTPGRMKPDPAILTRTCG